MCEINKAKPDTFYSQLFSRFYDPFMKSFEQKILMPHRRKLLEPLNGNILEIGSGTGINFPLYNKGTHVIASEPSGEMMSYAEKRLKEETIDAKITLIKAGVGDPLLERYIPKQGVDAIVCTLVLCTIPKPEAAFKDFKKWLKPNGKLLILEHIHGKQQPRKIIHEMINPLWKQFAEGCHLTRHTDELLTSFGFKPQEEKYFTKGLPFYRAVMAPDKNN